MYSRYHVGDKIIGLESWASAQPQVGDVLLTNIDDEIDPLHDLLINTSKRKITVRNSLDYQQRAATLQNTTKLLQSSLTAKYSDKTESRLSGLLALLNSRLGQKLLNRETVIYRFFKEGVNPLALRLRIYWLATFRFFTMHTKNIVCGTFDLVLGDLLQFYSIRLRIRGLFQEIQLEEKKMHDAEWYDRFIPTDSERLVDRHNKRISDLKNQIEELNGQKAEISRAFIAIIIAVASLFLSILNVLRNT